MEYVPMGNKKFNIPFAKTKFLDLKRDISIHLLQNLPNGDRKFIAKKRKNMKIQNTDEEKKLLRERRRIENFNQRLKGLVGEDFSRFRVWDSAKAVIAMAIVAINLRF
ncbi:MAG: hypothetical protein LBG86_01625 [Puniceicoccales bacterium]|jgi:hypothetical protein|nr:hypothetical protein [Puniceicoccales bacterium]